VIDKYNHGILGHAKQNVLTLVLT